MAVAEEVSLPVVAEPEVLSAPAPAPSASPRRRRSARTRGTPQVSLPVPVVAVPALGPTLHTAAAEDDPAAMSRAGSPRPPAGSLYRSPLADVDYNSIESIREASVQVDLAVERSLWDRAALRGRSDELRVEGVDPLDVWRQSGDW